MGKNFISILLVLAAALCTTPMRGDSSEKTKKVIPIKNVDGSELIRNLPVIQAFYLDAFSTIQTTVASDIGLVEISVTNLMTGESLWSTFDSGETSQIFLPISGSAGYYQVEYITESGDVYVGEFLIE